MEPSLSPVLFLTALAAGMVSCASPCVLPLVPAYIGFITGRSAEELQGAHGRARVTILTQGVAFVLGMLTIERFSGVVLIGMGLLLFTEQLTRITSLLTRVFGNGLAL